MGCLRARLVCALASCLLFAGCATWSDSFRDIERNLAEQRYDEALLALERQGDAKSDQLLYLLNKGMVQRMAGDFRASNETLEAAKKRMEELSALSLREQTTAFVINDGSRAYAGEEHEQVLVHLYEALNYIALGDLDNARVEALQVDVTLRAQAERTKESRYTDDAFARYLTGMIFEDLGEWSDAMIAYRKSYEAYQKYQKLYGATVPQSLKHDLLRLTGHLGLADEQRRYQKEFGIEQWTKLSDWREQGELVLFLHNGLAPLKRERSTAVLDPGSGHLIRISLPFYESRSSVSGAARIVAAEREARTEVFEDVQAISQRALQDKMPAITARALARAVVKGVASKAARDAAHKKNGGDSLGAAFAGLAVEVAGVLTERADTRSWATLPRDIQVARLALPPGTYRIKVELMGSGAQAVKSFELQDIVVRPGRKTYLSRHWTASYATSLASGTGR